MAEIQGHLTLEVVGAERQALLEMAKTADLLLEVQRQDQAVGAVDLMADLPQQEAMV